MQLKKKESPQRHSSSSVWAAGAAESWCVYVFPDTVDVPGAATYQFSCGNTKQPLFFFMLRWNNGERCLSKCAEHVSLLCVARLSINAVVRERVSRIIARREIT